MDDTTRPVDRELIHRTVHDLTRGAHEAVERAVDLADALGTAERAAMLYEAAATLYALAETSPLSD